MHYLEKELNNLIRTDSGIFRFLQEGSLDGIWYWDLEKPENEWMSPEFWRLFGCEPEGMPHTPEAWMSMIHPDDLATAQTNFTQHLEDPDHPYDQIVRYRHAEGAGWVTVRCRGIAIRGADGTPLRMLGAHTDLTALKAKEDQLLAANAALAKAHGLTARALQVKTTFLETMSHEIRTPLNGILGMSEVLAARMETGQDKHFVEVINASARRLIDLLTEVLDLTKAEAGLMEDRAELLNTQEVLTGIHELFEPDAVSRNLSLVLDDTVRSVPLATGSSRSVHHVAMNLVSNALKFTKAGQVTVSAQMIGQEAGAPEVLELRVADSGPGVQPEDRDMIFSRFFRSSRDQEKTGTGLGLNIAKRICEAHGGTLRLADTPGGGATFVAQFAVDPPDAAQRPLEVAQ